MHWAKYTYTHACMNTHNTYPLACSSYLHPILTSIVHDLKHEGNINGGDLKEVTRNPDIDAAHRNHFLYAWLEEKCTRKLWWQSVTRSVLCKATMAFESMASMNQLRNWPWTCLAAWNEKSHNTQLVNYILSCTYIVVPLSSRQQTQCQ